MEERILRRMPELYLGGLVPAAGCTVLADTPLTAILSLAFATAWGLSLVPLALGCLALTVAKR
jgi:hypothetical protein